MKGALSRNDILVVNGSPNILPVTAGIITTELQSPLSHITLLGINRKIAVFSLKDAWTNEKLRSFEGELVEIEVNHEGYSIRAASKEDLKRHILVYKRKFA